MEININSSNFENEVVKSDKPVLIDFWAPWCGPCQMIAPAVEELAKEYADKLKVGKVNVDEAPDLATQFSIMSIPALMLFKDGQVMEKKVGAMQKDELVQFVAPYLG